MSKTRDQRRSNLRPTSHQALGCVMLLVSSQNEDLGPSLWLLIALPVGVGIFMGVLACVCFCCRVYKLRNSKGAVTYTSTRPVGVGGVHSTNPHHVVYPAGTVIHPQIQPGTPYFNQGASGTYPPPTMQGGAPFPQGTVFVQGGAPMNQATLFVQGGTQITQEYIPQQSQDQQGSSQPPPYTPNY